MKMQLLVQVHQAQAEKLLFSLPPFVKWLAEFPAKGTLRDCLSELYQQQLRSKSVVDVEPFVSRISCFESNSHNGDAHLFLCDVIATLENEEESESEKECHIREMFGGIIKVSEQCMGCNVSSEQKHLNTVYPIYLDTNKSIQEAIRDYDNPQIIPCDMCDGSVKIQQTIAYAPGLLIFKAEDVEGAPAIDLTCYFGECSYELIGIIIREFTHFQTIGRRGDSWYHFNDSSVRSIKLGQLLLNDKIKSSLFMAVYCKVVDANKNSSSSIQSNVAKLRITTETRDIIKEVIPVNENTFEEPIGPVNFESADTACNTEESIPSNEDDVEKLVTPVNNVKKKVWSPSTPTDLTTQLAAAEVLKLESYDPLLTENDVPGAILPFPLDNSIPNKALVRWLQCRGAATANLNKQELMERIKIRMQNKSCHIIDPSIDKFKWYNLKKQELEKQNPTSKPPFLPLFGWGEFPSIDMPELFNWGHAHVYLIETAPNWTSAFDFSDEEDECFSQDIADNVGQTNIPNKGKRFLNSDHIIEVMDTRTEEYYFVKARIQASMASKVYFTTVTIRIISGSVRDSSCYCKQRALGRCSHVAALLLYITRHTEEKGYGALSCTDKPCSWGQGSKEKDPGLITKQYKASTNPLRSCFNPYPTALQHKTEEELQILMEDFLRDVQRLYVTEPPTEPKGVKQKKKGGKASANAKDKKKNKNKKKKKGKTPEEEATTTKVQGDSTQDKDKDTTAAEESEDEDEFQFEYLFDLHLEFTYKPYSEPVDNVKNVIQMCKSFAEDRTTASQVGPRELIATTGQSKNREWRRLRCLYFPSSISKRIFHMTPRGYHSFLREHLWQMKKFRGNRATKYGNNNEGTARTAYENFLKTTDPSAEIRQSAMWTNSKCPELSCSPDGVITRDFGDDALLEIKCPILLQAGNPKDFEKTLTKKQMKRFCLQRSNGHLSLKRDHPYFYQIQMAMGITEIHKCHFVVWSPKDYFYEEVKYDHTFFCKLKDKMSPLFWKLMVPEYFFMRTPRRLDPCLLHYNID